MTSKRYKKLPENTKDLKPENIDKVLSSIKSNCTTKFDESIDLSFRINNKQKKSEINLRTVVNMPGGTGNAFMHDLNATTYEKAFSLIIQNKTKKIDIMKLVCNNIMEYSFNIVGWGMASDINSLAEKHPNFPKDLK